MDIHRSRFVPYPPAAINALAFSHANDKELGGNASCLRLAIGRANGNIEIWNPADGLWLHERTFSGGKDRSVEGLVWTQDPDEEDEEVRKCGGRLRLFSIGYTSSVTEWDLKTGLPARHSDGNHSEIWCVAAQPRHTAGRKSSKNKVSVAAIAEGTSPSQPQNLVAGCADGTLVLLATENNSLRFQKFLSRSTGKKSRVLSVTYQNRNNVVAGFADSTIRIFDIPKSQVLRSISLGAGPTGGPREVLVWKVKCLPNGNIVSADSTGDVRFYDGRNYSQLQRISSHRADVLDLAVSKDGQKVFSAGMDRRTTLYSIQEKKGAGDKRPSRWREIRHRRFHHHDVKAMATFEGKSMSVVASGGIDARLVVAPIDRFDEEYSRTISALPHIPPLSASPEIRLMVSWWNCELRIWRIKKKTDGSERPKVIARMALQSDENITSASISRDGQLLAVATAAELKVFQLISAKTEAHYALRIRKLDTPSILAPRLVQFSPDGKWLAITTHNNEIRLTRVSLSSSMTDEVRILPVSLSLQRLIRKNIPRDPLQGYYRSITHVEFSADGSVLAVADLAGYVDTWVMQGYEDSTAPEIDVGDMASSASSSGDEDSDVDPDEDNKRSITIRGQRWIRNPSGHSLPRLDSAPLLLTFRPTLDATKDALQPNGNPGLHPTRNNPHVHSHDLPQKEQRLVVVSAQHRMYEFDILKGRLSEWSRRNPSCILPEEFLIIKDRVKGSIWDVKEDYARLWMYGESWLFMFDLSKDLAPNESAGNVQKKRKLEHTDATPRKKNRGAGDAVREAELASAIKLRKSGGENANGSAWINLNDRQSPGLEDDLEGNDTLLADLRRNISNGDGEGDALSEKNNEVRDAQIGKLDWQNSPIQEGSTKSWWHTLKYRPILGIVPLRNYNEPLEVVLVERPPWDLDLPPRFVGAHER